jgi:Bacteriophage abortive infection AbiH
MKLYILGNGFDLWHGLPTSYANFYAFAKATLDEVESYFHINLSKAASPWHDFENYLGTFNWRQLYHDYNYTDVRSDDFKPSHVYGFQDELVERTSELVDSIEAQFHDWVEGIDVSAARKQIVLDPTCRFITFNYTSTLQKVYGIGDKYILHIHGRAGEDELEFGHGVNIVEEPEFDVESGDSNRTIFSDAEASAKYPLHAFKKRVEAIINRNRSYFTSLRDISEIIVIGHSLNDVDLPYFREIARNATDCNWVVYCYDGSDWQHHPKQLIHCGVTKDRIFTRPYDDQTPSVVKQKREAE